MNPGGTLTVNALALMGNGNVTVASGGLFNLNGTSGSSPATLYLAGTAEVGLVGVAQYSGITVAPTGLFSTANNYYSTTAGVGSSKIDLSTGGLTPNFVVQSSGSTAGTAVINLGASLVCQQISLAVGNQSVSLRHGHGGQRRADQRG